MFLNDEQQQLANDIAERLIARGETLAVAESTSGGLVSAALLAVAGASRYYAGGGVLYTLNSRTALAGVPAETYANYRGTTGGSPRSLRRCASAGRHVVHRRVARRACRTRRGASRDLRQLPRDHAGDARHARRSDARTSPGICATHRGEGIELRLSPSRRSP